MIGVPKRKHCCLGLSFRKKFHYDFDLFGSDFKLDDLASASASTLALNWLLLVSKKRGNFGVGFGFNSREKHSYNYSFSYELN